MKGREPWICCLAAAVIIAGLLFAVFGPTVRTSTGTATSSGESRSEESTKSLFDDGIEPVTRAFIGLVAAVAAVATVLGGAAVAGLRGRYRPARPAALVAAAILLVLAVISGFSTGMLLLPGALLGVIGAACWDSAAYQPVRNATLQR